MTASVDAIAELAVELEKSLDEELETVAALLAIVDEKKEALKSYDTTAIHKILQREQELVRQLTECENQRFDIQRALEDRVDVNVHPLRLESLREWLPAKICGRLEQKRDNLRETTSRLRDENEQAIALIQQSLQYIQFSLALIGQAVGESYTPEGKKQHLPESRKLNQRG